MCLCMTHAVPQAGALMIAFATPFMLSLLSDVVHGLMNMCADNMTN